MHCSVKEDAVWFHLTHPIHAGWSICPWILHGAPRSWRRPWRSAHWCCAQTLLRKVHPKD